MRRRLALLALGCAAFGLFAFVAAVLAASSVTISAPRNSGLVSGTTTITAYCTNVGTVRTISSVKYKIDSGSLVSMVGTTGSTSGTFTAAWNTTTSTNATHTITVTQTLDNLTSVSGTTTVKVANPAAITLTVPSTTALAVAMDTTKTTNLALNVKTSLPWSLTVQANHALQATSAVIPSQRLAFTSSTDGSGSPVTTSTQFPTVSSTAVLSGGSPTTSSGDNVTVQYLLRATFDDAAGTYTATHTYIATTQ